ncbi:MAG: DUF885 domain-containing protein [Gammaproteobacteria bacterium]|nr:DUF885 domain-containing protein [Gammaproteobacteria bacterium]
MRMAATLLLYLAFVIGCGSGSGGPATTAPAPPPPPPPPTASEVLAQDLQNLALDEFYFESFKALISRSPETVVAQALTDIFPLDSVGMDDYSEEYRLETYAMYQVVLDALQTYERAALDDREKLDFDVYEWYLQDNVDQLEFFYYDFVATYMLFSAQRETERFFTDIHPLTSQQDAEDYITRLNSASTKIRQVAEHLLRQQNAGIVEPALSLNIALSQVSAIANGAVDANPFFTRFRDALDNIPNLSGSTRDDLRGRARAATLNDIMPAYQVLQSRMQQLLGSASPSIGVGQFPRGSDYYSYSLRHHSTTDLTPAEVHQLGLDELQRIHAEMRLLFDQLGYPQDETLQELYARVETDGGIIPAADVLATYESIIDGAEQKLDQAFDIFPSADVVVLPDPFGGFYIGPSFDGSRPGAFYAGTTTDQPYFQMPSLTYHESVPGHHTQIALAMELDVPEFRKLVRFTGFVEGWALYAERLAFELGWYDNDIYGDLGRLQFEALRAARLAMDTGIHSLGWSFNDAVQFNEDNVGASNAASQGAAARYSVWPGQATAYMIGMLQILDSRQRAMDELGSQFDLTAFHRALLSNGAVPLSLLDTVVDQYIADTLANP